MRRIALVGLLVVAIGGLAAVLLRDDGHGLDLEAIGACARPLVHEPREFEEQQYAGSIALEPIADLPSPLAMDRWPDGRLVVALREGTLVLLDEEGTTEKILDLRDRIELNAEGGILGLAVDPADEYVYVHHTDLEGTSHILSFRLDAGSIDLDSERDLLQVEHPGLVHNGGHLSFGPDDMLYLGFGDGALRVDVALDSRSRDTFAAKLLRIDPTPGAEEPYAIPADNPDAAGDLGAPEIYLTGLRNPWRFSFDRETGDLWIGDVGNDCWEEINVLRSGEPAGDFGWPDFEGDHALAADADEGTSRWPVLTSRHGPSCAVIGGYVYRGDALADLDGAYVYSDLCDGELRWLRASDEGPVVGGPLGVQQDFPVAFWQDEEGELYLMTAEDGIFLLAPA